MAQDIFLKLNGIDGEAQDSIHKDEIDVLRWEWLVSQSSNMHAGSGGGAEKCTVEDLHFEHYIDRATPNLLQYCLTGKHIPEAILTICKAGGSPLEYLRITLQNIIITNVKSIGYYRMHSPRERVSLSFSRVKMDYVVQNAQGDMASVVSTGYDIKANATI